MSEAQAGTTHRRGRLAALAALAAGAGAVAWALRDLPAAFGRRPDGEREERLRNSPQYRDGVFHNAPSELARPTAQAGIDVETVRRALFQRDGRTPSHPVPTVRPAEGAGTAAEGVAVTWYGHASALVEVEGARVLLDPIWSDRCSPPRRSARAGCTRCRWSWRSCRRWTRC